MGQQVAKVTKSKDLSSMPYITHVVERETTPHTNCPMTQLPEIKENVKQFRGKKIKSTRRHTPVVSVSGKLKQESGPP